MTPMAKSVTPLAFHGVFSAGGMSLQVDRAGETIIDFPLPPREWRPEHELAKEVLLLAISDLRSRKRRPRADAIAWFENTQTRGPFSLHGICETLGLDMHAVRDAAKQHAQEPPRAKRRGRYVRKG